MDRETRIKRLYFRSAHRGSKEIDLILGPYASAQLQKMDDKELDEFESFLSENDTDIWYWVVGKSSPEGGKYTGLLSNLRKIYELKTKPAGTL